MIMKLGTKYWRSSLVVVGVVVALLGSTMVFADNINPGVLAINGQVGGLTYGQWSAKWWQWAFLQTTFDNCPNESGPVWFLAAPTHTDCTVPPQTNIMFPTFNVEWSVEEAKAQEAHTGGT